MVRARIFPRVFAAASCGNGFACWQAVPHIAVVAIFAALAPREAGALRLVPFVRDAAPTHSVHEYVGDNLNGTYGCRVGPLREELFCVLPSVGEVVYSPLSGGLCSPEMQTFTIEQWRAIFSRDLFAITATALFTEPGGCRLDIGEVALSMDCSRRKDSIDIVLAGSRGAFTFPDKTHLSFPRQGAGPCGCTDMRRAIAGAWRSLSEKPAALGTYLRGLDLKDDLRFVLGYRPLEELGAEADEMFVYRMARDLRVGFEQGVDAAISTGAISYDPMERYMFGQFVWNMRRTMAQMQTVHMLIEYMSLVASMLVNRVYASHSGTIRLVGEIVLEGNNMDNVSTALTLDGLGIDPQLPPPAAPAL